VSLLRIDSVDKSFWRGPSEVTVLRDATLEVRAGQFVAIYGRRNAGKTTLLEVAAGLTAPDGGAVTFDGDDLAHLSRHDLAYLHRERIAWVERAGPHRREMAVGTYVALPLYRKLGPHGAQRRAAVALERAGVGDCADLCWGELSDAARILVAIAQALARGPSVLILDDPTAGLGIVDRERVVGLLRAAAEGGGLGVLMAVPDMPAMLRAHEVRLLNRGRLMASGGPPDGGNVVDFPRDKRSA
jgi:ABC-type multidrug transport system ATPase subunit